MDKIKCEDRSHLTFNNIPNSSIKERDLKIYEERKKGLTYLKLQKKFNINRERISQICKRVKKLTTN